MLHGFSLFLHFVSSQLPNLKRVVLNCLRALRVHTYSMYCTLLWPISSVCLVVVKAAKLWYFRGEGLVPIVVSFFDYGWD